MAFFKVFLGLALGCFFAGKSLAMSTGPPMEACARLEPNHNTTQQASAPPVEIVALESSYTPTDGNILECEFERRYRLIHKSLSSGHEIL